LISASVVSREDSSTVGYLPSSNLSWLLNE
jgi:hypothetical protein